MITDEIAISKALSVLERIAAMMCRAPDKVRMDAPIGASKIEIVFRVGSTVDSKRIVGTRGARLTNFQTLAAMMMRDSGKEIIMGHVERDEECECPTTTFKADPNWPKEQMEVLFKDAVEACFPEREVAVRSRDSSSEGTWLYAGLSKLDEESSEFTDVAQDLFSTAGIQVGRRIVVETEQI